MGFTPSPNDGSGSGSGGSNNTTGQQQHGSCIRGFTYDVEYVQAMHKATLLVAAYTAAGFLQVASESFEPLQAGYHTWSVTMQPPAGMSMEQALQLAQTIEHSMFEQLKV